MGEQMRIYDHAEERKTKNGMNGPATFQRLSLAGSMFNDFVKDAVEHLTIRTTAWSQRFTSNSVKRQPSSKALTNLAADTIACIITRDQSSQNIKQNTVLTMPELKNIHNLNPPISFLPPYSPNFSSDKPFALSFGIQCCHSSRL